MGFSDYKRLMNDPITKEIRNDKQFKDAIQIIKDKLKEQQNILASMKSK